MVLRLFLGVLLAPASVTAVIEIKPGKVVQDQMLSPTRSPVLQTGRSISVVVPKHISGQRPQLLNCQAASRCIFLTASRLARWST